MPEQTVQTPRDIKQQAKAAPAGVQWPFVPRPMDREDENLIYGSWLGTLRNQAPYVHMTNKVFRAGQIEVIKNIIERPGPEIMVAASPSGEPKFGFICGEHTDEGFVLHYILTKPVYQRKNIASALLQFMGVRPKTQIIASHWTGDLRWIRKNWTVDYHPWLAWRI